MVQKSGQPVDMVKIPLFTGSYTSQVVSRISSINSRDPPMTWGPHCHAPCFCWVAPRSIKFLLVQLISEPISPLFSCVLFNFWLFVIMSCNFSEALYRFVFFYVYWTCSSCAFRISGSSSTYLSGTFPSHYEPLGSPWGSVPHKPGRLRPHRGRRRPQRDTQVFSVYPKASQATKGHWPAPANHQTSPVNLLLWCWELDLRVNHYKASHAHLHFEVLDLGHCKQHTLPMDLWMLPKRCWNHWLFHWQPFHLRPFHQRPSLATVPLQTWFLSLLAHQLCTVSTEDSWD